MIFNEATLRLSTKCHIFTLFRRHYDKCRYAECYGTMYSLIGTNHTVNSLLGQRICNERVFDQNKSNLLLKII